MDVAVLAVEKPQENVKEAFSGGQNGRFIPAPRIFYNLFRKDDRPKEDKSWLDRVTDSIIDKLELRWEDDEEARMEVKFVDHDHHHLFLHGNCIVSVQTFPKSLQYEDCVRRCT